MKVRAVAERHASGRPVPRRNGDVSDWRLYGRLLGYIVPYWYIFLFSLLGYVVYSLGNVLLADLMQFLLDSLNESDQVESGIVAGAAYRLLDSEGMTKLEFARIAVPAASIVGGGRGDDPVPPEVRTQLEKELEDWPRRPVEARKRITETRSAIEEVDVERRTRTERERICRSVERASGTPFSAFITAEPSIVKDP